MTEYFSEREQYASNERNIEDITENIWQGIKGIIKQFITNNGLAISFPMCESRDNNIYGCDLDTLDTAINAILPRMSGLEHFKLPISKEEDPWGTTEEKEQKIDLTESTYDILDLVEFICSKIKDVKELERDSFKNRYILAPVEGDMMKKDFQNSINDIFRRNHLVYELCDDGKIKRVVPVALTELFKVRHNTKDEELNNFLDLAVDKFISPKVEDRRIGLEKLWDAFERLKTIEYSQENHNKKDSATEVATKLGSGTPDFKDKLEEEMYSLREIGNTFEIRHSETDQTKIEDRDHIDYLFYRMYAFIHLFLTKYNL